MTGNPGRVRAVRLAPLAMALSATLAALAPAPAMAARGAPAERLSTSLATAERHQHAARVTTAPHPARAAAQAPRPDDDTATTTKFTVDGIPVILRRNTANENVTANIYLLGGTRQLTPKTAGIEALLLAAGERGTRRFPGARARQLSARLGSTISLDPTDDWSVYSLRALRTTFDSTWAIMADQVVAPTLAPEDVALVRDQLIASIRQRGLSPDATASELADSLVNVGTPYANPPTGTVESISAITIPQLREYHATQVVRSRMLVVVVGNIDRPRVERLVHGTLGTLPLGNYRWTPPPAIPVLGPTVAFDNRQLPTNYILGYAPGPVATSPDHAALRVAAAILSGRLFSEVRSQRNLSYAVESPFVERGSAIGGLYVTTVDPNAVLRIMHDELTALQTEEVDARGLKRLEQQFITEFYLKNETNAEQANLLARADLYEGDYRAADQFMARLRRVTPADIRRVATKYLTGFRFAYVGDSTKVDPALLRF